MNKPSISPQSPCEKPLLRALRGQRVRSPPVWLMRQAGRYLPEYRELRARAGSFLDFCLDPDLAVEATLQPIRRYAFDAAILFSDILLVPHALGQKVWFEDGKGPRLDPLRDSSELNAMRGQGLREGLAPVYEAVRGVRDALPKEVSLIGFAGAPWTVAAYMLEGGGSADFAIAKRWTFAKPGATEQLIDLLVDATVDHLLGQVEAGAEVLQIFDSWAGILPDDLLLRWSLIPMREITRRVKNVYPTVPVIVFPRGARALYRDFAVDGGADALSLDSTVSLEWARSELQPRIAIQGNLDPRVLAMGGSALEHHCKEILEAFSGGPFIFNLGHGILPQTPPDNVAHLVRIVRGWQL